MKCAEAVQQGIDAMVKRAHDRIANAQLPADVRANLEERTKQLDALAPRLRAVIANRCVDDKWPGEVIACYAKVTSMDEARACRAKLSPEQQATVQRDEVELMTSEGGPPGFGSAAAVMSPEATRLQQELRTLNASLVDATKRYTDAKTDAERAAAKATLDQIEQEMRELNAKLDDARAKAAVPQLPP